MRWIMQRLQWSNTDSHWIFSVQRPCFRSIQQDDRTVVKWYLTFNRQNYVSKNASNNAIQFLAIGAHQLQAFIRREQANASGSTHLRALQTVVIGMVCEIFSKWKSNATSTVSPLEVLTVTQMRLICPRFHTRICYSLWIESAETFCIYHKNSILELILMTLNSNYIGI